jgi:hypothetical protein
MGLGEHLGRPAAVLVVLPRDRADLLLREVVGKLAKALLLVGEREVDHLKVSLKQEVRRKWNRLDPPPAPSGD